MNINFPNVFSEVYEVVEHFPSEYIEKIPEKFLKCIRDLKNNRYVFEYDFSKSLMEQNISEPAKDIIAYLYIGFIAEKV